MEPQSHGVAHLPDADGLQHSRVPELSKDDVRLELHGSLVIVGFYAPHKPWVTPETEKHPTSFIWICIILERVCDGGQLCTSDYDNRFTGVQCHKLVYESHRFRIEAHSV